MNTILKKQEVAQGVKLGSFKEFQTLNSNELKGIEGGWFIPALVGALIGVALTQDIDRLVDAFNEGYNLGKKR